MLAEHGRIVIAKQLLICLAALASEPTLSWKHGHATTGTLRTLG